jgi:hypothetical protein
VVEKKLKKGILWLGPVAYVLGILVAIIAGFLMPGDGNVMTLLAALGIIVGVVNVKDKEKEKFLLAALTFLMVAMSLGVVTQVVPYIGEEILHIVYYVTIFTAPAAAVVSLLVINEVASGK